MRNLTWRAETRYRSHDNAACLAVPLFVQSQRLLCAKAAANLGVGHSDPKQSLRLVHIHPDMTAAWGGLPYARPQSSRNQSSLSSVRAKPSNGPRCAEAQ